MIRSDVVENLASIDNAIAFYSVYPSLARETVVDIFNAKIKRPFTSELRYTPGKSKHPFVFATAKSRRKYFAMIRSGEIPTDGKRYLRTGKTMKKWSVDIGIFDNDIIISAKNTARHIKWLTGNRQVPGHKNTGWPLHKPTIDYWRDVTREEVVGGLHKLINGRRGLTR